MKHTVRNFSVGLLASSVILLIVFYFIEDPVQTAENMDPTEMIPYIEEAGYKVLTTEEYVAFSINKENNSDKNAAKAEKQAKEKTDSAQVKNDSKESKESKKTEDKFTKDSQKEEEKTEKDSAATDEENTETDTHSYTLNVKPGMASSDISNVLAEQNMIEDASEFNGYLIEHDYHLKVQIGTFDVSSDMSFYELAEAISN